MTFRGKYEKYHKELKMHDDFLDIKPRAFVHQNLNILTQFSKQVAEIEWPGCLQICWSSCWLPPP